MATAYAKEAPRNYGSVIGRATKTFTFDVNVQALTEYELDNADEIIIRVNGQLVRRMNVYAAKRMGLVTE